VQRHEGEGWRLQLDQEREPFPVLIGGSGWAAEFTTAEALELARMAGELERQLTAMTDRLMADERITLELERTHPWGSLWIELEGVPQGWSLRFVLTPEPPIRALEGSWSPRASAAISAALQLLSAVPAGDPPTGPHEQLAVGRRQDAERQGEGHRQARQQQQHAHQQQQAHHQQKAQGLEPVGINGTATVLQGRPG
jgi:hypothetical protein